MKKRIIGLDLLRGIAAFGIVGCHLELATKSPVANVLLHYCDLNVAVFAAISGVVMYDGLFQKPIGEYVRKRLCRLLPVYVLWSVVFVLFSFAFKVVSHAPLEKFATFAYWVNVLFKGDAACHLWFLVCLLYAQIGMRAVLRPKTPLWVIFLFSIASIVIASNVGENWYGFYLMRLVGFVLLGYCMKPILEWSRKSRMIVLWAFFISSLLIHWFLTCSLPPFVRDFIVVVPVLLIADRVSVVNGTAINAITFFAATSLGVYLVHPMLAKVGGLVVDKCFNSPVGLVPVLLDWLFSYGAALCVTAILLKIPHAKKFVQ